MLLGDLLSVTQEQGDWFRVGVLQQPYYDEPKAAFVPYPGWIQKEHVLSVTAQPCEPTTLSIPTTPGEIVYLWAGPNPFDSPGGVPFTFTYDIDVCGSVDGIIATESTTWGNLKSLYK